MFVAPKIWILPHLKDQHPTYVQQRLAPLDHLYDERHLNRLYESDGVNTQYVQSVVCEEFEKQMCEAILQKVIMNGSVPDMLEKVAHDDIRKKIDKLHKVFYDGDELTNFE